jgi:hypothetical protein
MKKKKLLIKASTYREYAPHFSFRPKFYVGSYICASVVDPDRVLISIGSLDPYPDPSGLKWTTEIENRNFFIF